MKLAKNARNLSFGFIQQEIQVPSEQIFPFGAEGKGGPPPLPRRKREKMAEGIESPMNKPKTQVLTAWVTAMRQRLVLREA